MFSPRETSKSKPAPAQQRAGTSTLAMGFDFEPHRGKDEARKPQDLKDFPDADFYNQFDMNGDLGRAA